MSINVYKSQTIPNKMSKTHWKICRKLGATASRQSCSTTTSGAQQLCMTSSGAAWRPGALARVAGSEE